MSSATTDAAATRRRHPPQSYRPIPPNFREDCWSEDETHALIDAWGSIHLALNRGSLRQHQWFDVSTAVNSTVRRRSWTDVQCKNRIDTLKKKYKVEKAKVAGDNNGYVSPWPFFNRLDFLIAGDTHPSQSPAVDTPPVAALRSFPVKRRSVLPKRPARWLTEEEDSPRQQSPSEGASVGDGRSGGGDGGEEDGYRMLAEAIRRLGEVYERVESMKQEQVMELEKHRMEFAKDLELQRIKLLMDTQNQLFSSIKRSKLNHNDDDVGELSC